MTRQIVIHKWHRDKPEVNEVVWVWWLNQTVQGVWDGNVWRTVEGDILTEVTHWRPYRD